MRPAAADPSRPVQPQAKGGVRDPLLSSPFQGEERRLPGQRRSPIEAGRRAQTPHPLPLKEGGREGVPTTTVAAAKLESVQGLGDLFCDTDSGRVRKTAPASRPRAKPVGQRQ